MGRRSAGDDARGTARTLVRLPSGVLLAGLVLALGASPAAAAPLTETGRRAYETARSADDGATAAFEEGEKTLALLKALVPEREVVPPTLKPYLEQGEAAHQALVGYRRLTQASSTDALRLLADVGKLPIVPGAGPRPAGHARAARAPRGSRGGRHVRTDPNGGRASSRDPRRGSPGHGGWRDRPRMRRAPPWVPRVRPDARLRASRPCARPEPDRGPPGRGGAGAGGRGASPRPRHGAARRLLVNQSPEAGGSAAPQSGVSVTLSGTAATITPPR